MASITGWVMPKTIKKGWTWAVAVLAIFHWGGEGICRGGHSVLIMCMSICAISFIFLIHINSQLIDDKTIAKVYICLFDKVTM